MKNEEAPKGLTSAATATRIVARTADITEVPMRVAGLPVLPVVYATAYEPSDGLTKWWAVYCCPTCGGGRKFFGDSLDELRGTRRTRCRHGRVWVVIARVRSVKAVSDAA